MSYFTDLRDGKFFVNKVVQFSKDNTAYQQDTIDIWVVFTEEKVTLSYKKNSIDVTEFKILK